MISRFEQFSSVISSIYGAIQKIEREEMAKYGLKGAYAQYLVAVKRFPEGVTSTELCELCDKDKAAVSRIVAEKCDFLISIPMKGKINSLNASVAAGIIIYNVINKKG